MGKSVTSTIQNIIKNYINSTDEDANNYIK